VEENILIQRRKQTHKVIIITTTTIIIIIIIMPSKLFIYAVFTTKFNFYNPHLYLRM
jgi:hypothetical protein